MSEIPPISSTNGYPVSKVLPSTAPAVTQSTSQVPPNSEQLISDLTTRSGIRPANTTDPQKLHQQLEAMLIGQMLKGVITDQMASEFGDGIQGDYFSSVFTNAISEKLAENGSLSLAPALKQ